MLNDNNHTRNSDGAIMVEVERGWFVSRRALTIRHAANDNAPKEEHGPEKTVLEALEHSMTESPDNISMRYVVAALGKLFESKKLLSKEEDDDTFNTTGKRRVRSNPRCNLAISTERVSILKKEDDKLFLRMAAHAIGYQHFTIDTALALILKRRRDTQVPAVLGDTSEESSRNRDVIERYNIERPEKDYPEHTLYSRDPRNVSPTRTKSTKQLTAFWDYRDLNKSAESLQSNWGKADNDNHNYADREEGEEAQLVPVRDAEAELETHPGIEDLERIISSPAVEYETRQVGFVDGPKLSDCGYCMSPTSREIKFPVSGDVVCVGFRKDRVAEYEHAARMSLAGMTIKRTRKQINTYLYRIAKPERLGISAVDKTRPWSIWQMGDLRFATERSITIADKS
jgi:hypothetical protein